MLALEKGCGIWFFNQNHQSKHSALTGCGFVGNLRKVENLAFLRKLSLQSVITLNPIWRPAVEHQVQFFVMEQLPLQH